MNIRDSYVHNKTFSSTLMAFGPDTHNFDVGNTFDIEKPFLFLFKAKQKLKLGYILLTFWEHMINASGK